MVAMAVLANVCGVLCLAMMCIAGHTQLPARGTKLEKKWSRRLEREVARIVTRNEWLESVILKQTLELERLNQENEEFKGLLQFLTEELVTQKKEMLDIEERIIKKMRNRFPLDEKPSENLEIAKRPEYDRQRSSELNRENSNKRSDDLGALDPVIGQMSQKLTEMAAEIDALKNQDEALKGQNEALVRANNQQDSARGTTYIRWGHAACPNSSEIVYSGYAGGSLYSSPGAASNHLCLTPDPRFDTHPVTRYGFAEIYGSEYETCDEPECDTTPACAVCRIPRSSSLMVPGTNTCTPGWTVEYSGYIMASKSNYHGTEYICVDSSHGYVPGTQADESANPLYYTVFRCQALPCPPYMDGKVALCAVCSK